MTTTTDTLLGVRNRHTAFPHTAGPIHGIDTTDRPGEAPGIVGESGPRQSVLPARNGPSDPSPARSRRFRSHARGRS